MSGKQSFNMKAFSLFLLLIISSMACVPVKNELFVKGIKSYDEEQYRTAITYFTDAINDEPGNAELYFYRAKAKMQLDSCKDAIDDYSRAIILDKTKVEYFINRGLANITCQNYYSAIFDFDYAEVLDSTSAQIYFNRAYARESIRRLSRSY